MDEKGETQPDLLVSEEDVRSSRAGTVLPMPVNVLLIIGILYGLFQGIGILMMPTSHNMTPVTRIPQETVYGSSKVPLEAHIMSKCPDARDCLRDLVLPAMQNISDKVDFTLSYIGRPTNHDDGVECMHGPEECLGNIVELCAATLYPDPKIYLGFTMCLSNDYSHIPDEKLMKSCALEHGLDFEKLNDCSSKDDGAYGIDLLRQSVARSTNAHVQYSCTIRLQEEVRCIRDGGKWKDCPGGSTVEDLIRDIKDLSALYGLE